MRHSLPQVSAVHLQLLLLGEMHCILPVSLFFLLLEAWPRGLVPAARPRPNVVTRTHFLQLAGLAVMAVGIWTLALKSDYISLLASNTYLATAYILVVAGVVVMVTGVLGCCATFKERRNLLRLVSRAWWHMVGAVGLGMSGMGHGFRRGPWYWFWDLILVKYVTASCPPLR